MPYTATYYLNLNLRDKYFTGYQPGDVLGFVGVAEVSDLGEVFYAFNRVDKPVPVLDDAQAPSISVGDVVRLVKDDVVQWFVVESVGFKEIDPPDAISTQPVKALLDAYYSQSEGSF